MNSADYSLAHWWERVREREWFSNWHWLRFLVLALLLCSTAQAEVEVPPLKQRVTDLTATLDAAQIQALNARLATFESGKGSQIAVLIVPTTQPETIDQFGIRVVEAWKLGRKGVDDGVLLLIAKEDRKLRIEVGYGLEGALNDATAKRIVAEIISPYFKRGEFYAGIDAGVAAIIKVVEGEALPAPTMHTQNHTADDSLGNIGTLFVGALLIFLFGNLILRQFVGSLPSGLIVGGAIAGLVWMMIASLLVAGISGIFGLLLSLALGAKGTGMGLEPTIPYGFGGGGFNGGNDSGGGDGFSGGGGDFGGGGASGDW